MPPTYSYSSSSVLSPAALFSATSTSQLFFYLNNHLDLGTVLCSAQLRPESELSHFRPLTWGWLCSRHGHHCAQPHTGSQAVQPALLRSPRYFDACNIVTILLLLSLKVTPQSLLPWSSLVLWKHIKVHWDTALQLDLLFSATWRWHQSLCSFARSLWKRSQSNWLSGKHAKTDKIRT